jgi:hypothetical protein
MRLKPPHSERNTSARSTRAARDTGRRLVATGEQQDERRDRTQRRGIQWLNSEEKRADHVRSEVGKQQPNAEPDFDGHNTLP